MLETDVVPETINTRRLTILYVVALGLVGLLTISGQLIVQASLERLTGDSTVVNVAGRQRMLSQRLAKLTWDASDRETPKDRESLIEQLNQSLAAWQQSQHGLRYGDSQLQLPGNNSPTVAAMFERLAPDFVATESAVKQCIAILETVSRPESNMLIEPNRSQLLLHSEAFLNDMDAIVGQYEIEARSRVARLRAVERSLLLATLVVLLCEGLFVFSPAVSSIRRGIVALRQLTDTLAEAKLAADNANHAKSQFLTRMSHELRTPLHAVLGLVGLARSHTSSRRVRAWLSTTLSSARTLKGLVDDLLDLSGIESGKAFAVHNRPVALQALLRSCANSMRLAAERKGLALHCDLDTSLPKWVQADPHRLKQIIFNLVQNAIRYTDVGSITLRASLQSTPFPCDIPNREACQNSEPYAMHAHGEACNPNSGQFVRDANLAGSFVAIEVADTGCGLNASERVHILESFSGNETAKSLSSSPTGAACIQNGLFGSRQGLGLSITAGLLRAMRGKLELESELGQGSRFRVLLPLVVSERPAAKPQADSHSRDQPKRRSVRAASTTRLRGGSAFILVVDDDASNQIVMKAYLDRLGLNSIHCSSGQEAETVIANHDFAALLLDHRLPDVEGIELAERLSRIVMPSQAPILLVSADSAELLRGRNDLARISAVLAKPLAFKTLRDEFLRLGVLEIVSPSDKESDRVDNASVGSRNGRHEALRAALRAMYVRDFPSQFIELKAACQSNQMTQALLLAHRLRGSAANAGLTRPSAAAQKIEIAAKALSFDQRMIQVLLDDLEKVSEIS